VCGGGSGQSHDARDCPGWASLPTAAQGTLVCSVFLHLLINARKSYSLLR
jgi:hypothetical protein